MRRHAEFSRGVAWRGLVLAAGILIAGTPAVAGTPRDPAVDKFAGMRQRMVDEQIERRGVRDPRVLAAMRAVPRHLFVPDDQRARAYDDAPLPIGDGQTISQPYIVAFMTEAARLGPGDRVLEVGTGSGYQAAVLAAIGAEVRSIEILPGLAERARTALAAAGFGKVAVRTGDGFRGWPEAAPFDAVLVTAAPDEVPPPLLDQLKVGGRLVIPVGSGTQELIRVTRTAEGFERESLLPVRFVPMTGEAREPRH
jgi:protein-L-isoaspartate(D-aspartate) O-methyltransferase